MRKLKIWIAGLVMATSLVLSACDQMPELEISGSIQTTTEAQATADASLESGDSSSADESKTDADSSTTGQTMASSASSSATFSLAEVPEYSGDPYVAVHDNIPYFTEEELNVAKDSFEFYSELDEIGRCGVAYASVSTETMPTEKRGDISSVKPTGWHSVKYDNVDGKSLYNRCHLIGYQLTAENANKQNLITGTRYLNVDGMLPFENMVADYVKETKNHVLYRVTPIFEGDNLVASGVLMEAESVEDQGEGVLFCVYAYDVQPGITIDYATGESALSGQALAGVTAKSDKNSTAKTETETKTNGSKKEKDTSAETKTSEKSSTKSEKKQTYVLNVNTGTFHKPDCSSAQRTKEENKKQVKDTRTHMIEQGYSPCKQCNP
ncbi:DNA/RNA non-specific endonuclease [Brotaphodocola sp.]|uniref:DNA/RNA non-specific endonuclease n=1 Tax=Brotaphodocola sp. TaxID=3073577 RepID=UPI003D7D6EE5